MGVRVIFITFDPNVAVAFDDGTLNSFISSGYVILCNGGEMI